jgi:hypothetical protein
MPACCAAVRRFFSILAPPLLAYLLAASTSAQVPLPDARPVPKMQVLPLPADQASIAREGNEISRYHFAAGQKRPFLYPIAGPSGRSLTRMGHPHDPVGHSHHNSVWVSHHDVQGVDFWGDRGAGRIVHRSVERYGDADDAAEIAVVNAWQDDAGKTLLEERRRMIFHPRPGNEWLLVLQIDLAAAGSPVTLGKTPFGLVGVRMAKTIGVRDGGGTIRNSEGERDEAGVFWKRARWVDYSGPITPHAAEGVTLMDHPANPNHPTFFHVRNDGWMGASLTHDEPRTIEPGTPLRVRYGLYVHAGVPTAQALQRQFAEFAELKIAELPAKTR